VCKDVTTLNSKSMSDKKTNAAAPVAALKSKVKLIKGVFLVSPTAVYKLATVLVRRISSYRL
jgi:hypothetical protein